MTVDQQKEHRKLRIQRVEVMVRQTEAQRRGDMRTWRELETEKLKLEHALARYKILRRAKG